MKVYWSLIFVILAGCTGHAGVSALPSAPTTLMRITGSAPKLSEFQAAARQCGFGGVVREADGHGGEWVKIVGRATLIRDGDPALECTTEYLMRHPGDYYFVRIDR